MDQQILKGRGRARGSRITVASSNSDITSARDVGQGQQITTDVAPSSVCGSFDDMAIEDVRGKSNTPTPETFSLKRKNEDLIGTASHADSASRGSLILQTRPESVTSKQGTSGRPVKLSANYFSLNKNPSFDLVQYRVDLAPNVEATMIRKAILREQKTILGEFLFDGTTMFLTRRLPDIITNISTKRKDGSELKITLKYVNVVSMNDDTSLQTLNIILRSSMEGLKLQLVGRNLFDPQAKIDISDYKLQLWPGYQTSIRQHENNILVNCELQHKVMRLETVYDILQDCIRKMRDYKDSFIKQVVGCTVLTDYNNKTYRIDSVDFSSSPASTFMKKNVEVSYMDYYKKSYDIVIKDPKQPMLVSKPKAKDIRGGREDLIMLIPELCRSTGITDRMRNNIFLMSCMSEYTRLNPKDRIERLNTFNERVQSTPASVKVLNDWNMELSKELVTFNGRQLDQETIQFGSNNSCVNTDEADWTKQLKINPMFLTVPLKKWCLIHTSGNEKVALDFVLMLQNVGSKMKFDISLPIAKKILTDRIDDYVLALDESFNEDPDLIMCIVPNNRADRYAAIKTRCCVDNAVPSQVVLAKTITPKTSGSGTNQLASVALKVAIQLNCKLGGAPWMVPLPMTGLMTIGFDVSHDSNDPNLSFGVMVATMDLKLCTQYFSIATPFKNGEELYITLSKNVNRALKAYRDTHNTLPLRILFYRGGVGDGQIEYVYEHEVKRIKEELAEVYEAAGMLKPGLAYIIVNKRLNTRIFHGTSNPKSGTVVDDVITLPERYDFFLVSQSVRQGTVSPTSYNVIEDTMGLSADRLQKLTYKMCHLYYNWPGTVRVPAVCQYAQKLAFLSGQYLHRVPSVQFGNKLHFL